MNIFDETGNPVPLGQRLGGGGEAEIFDTANRRAAKIYRNPAPHREAKLRAMLAAPPNDPTLSVGHPSICWPEALLFEPTGVCVGFLMHRIERSTHVPAFKLYNPMDRQIVSQKITWKYLIRTAANFSAAVEAIHAQGHVIGDINESNILVGDNALVTLVDCDSMQVRDASKGTVYRCTVGKPDFTPPELQGCEFSTVDRSAVQDHFGIAIILFLLLMEGVHPFSGVWQKSGAVPVLGERIKDGISPYARHPDVSVMPAAPPFSLLPEKIRDMFVRCFKHGHVNASLRPGPGEWKEALIELEENLSECSSSPLHVYSKHLLACPWCERKESLGGVDPFPSQIQQWASKSGSMLATVGQRPLDIKKFRSKPRYPRRRILWSRIVKLSIPIMILILAGIFLWGTAHKPARFFSSFLHIPSFLSAKPTLNLSPLLICTGVDSDGAPLGVSDSFSQDQLKETGVMTFLTFSGASPQKTSFQFRWTIEGKTYQSSVNTFESPADYLYLNLGKDLPAGHHRIEFLVDGKVAREVTMVIHGTTALKTQRESPYPGAPFSNAIPNGDGGSAQDAGRKSAPIAAEVHERALSDHQEETVQHQISAPTERMVYRARHWHDIGSCDGELQLTPQSIQFSSESHTFNFDIRDVQLDGDGIKDASGKAWHFSIDGMRIELLLGKWMRGEIFPAATSREGALGKPTAGTELSLKKSYFARHKHRLGSCSGQLSLTAEYIEYSSDEHYFKASMQNIQIEGDQIRDQRGNTWRFEIPGEDVKSLLRSWKRGDLFLPAKH